MMSPDPPRSDPFNNESDSEGLPVLGGNFRLIDEEDDIMGEGEHVLDLDYSSQPESWSSDDDEEEDVTGHHEMEDEVDEAGNVRVRTQYRMLIPFQIIDDEPDFNHEDVVPQAASRIDGGIEISPTLSETIPAVESSDSTRELMETGNCQRETTPLSDENVQKIKEVMQSFKLPDSAIPNWAKEVTEDAWRKKLVDSLKSKKHEHKPN